MAAEAAIFQNDREYRPVIIGLTVADVHRHFKTETHFSNFGLAPHGSLLKALGKTRKRIDFAGSYDAYYT
jgi:hypothetical protein